MAAVTAEDIRTVAERVRAADQAVAPYHRRVPYEFEVFEPLMKMLPEERVPFRPPPRRPDETDSQYHVVWRNHLNAWHLQCINDYFKVKGGRLLSPSSDIDDDDDVRAHQVFRDQERLLAGMNIVDWEYFRIPIMPDPNEPPLEFWEEQLRRIHRKDLPNISSKGIGDSGSGYSDVAPSSSTLQRAGRYSRNISSSTEYGAGSAAEQQEMDGSILPSIEQSPERPQSGNGTKTSRFSSLQNGEPAQKQKWKRRSLPVEDDALERPSKKQMTDKQSPLSTALSTAGCKRKRDGEGLSDEMSSTGKPSKPNDKKRRLDAGWKTQSSQKRKRSSQGNDEELEVPQLEYEGPETKRRRVIKTKVINAEQSAQDVNPAAGSERTLATAPSPHMTRARWRQLPCEDAQLLQLDQRGKPDVQEPKHAAQKLVRELPAASRNGRRPKKAASTDAKNSRKTKTANATKAGVKASTTANTTTTTITKTITRTRSRNTSSKIRGKDQLSST